MNITKKDIKSFTEISNPASFEEAALKVFRFQYENNPVYNKWCRLLSIGHENVKKIEDIPFVPISFFKDHAIKSGEFKQEITFTSSGTTGQNPSKHHIKDLDVYEHSFLKSFDLFYGDPQDYHILALLPSYLEREGSSLIYMTDQLIKASRSSLSGFFLHDFEELHKTIREAEKDKSKKTLLLGVTYALLDFAEAYPGYYSNIIVMETGGMKGKRKEMVKEDFYPILKKGFGIRNIASEYGMTELLSQAYSLKNGEYKTPPWMKVLITNLADPFDYLPHQKTGKIQVVDLMNAYSCSFITTDDLGKTLDDHTFKILGRADNTESRGCNLMVF